MHELIERGHIYIAQPPLFRAKRGRTETYIKDERDLETFLIRRAVESRVVKLADGAELFGETLEHRLHRMIAYRKLLQLVDAPRHPPGDRDGAAADGRTRQVVLRAARSPGSRWRARMTTPNRTVSVGRDDEHNAFFLVIEDRSHGYPRRFVLEVDFVSSGEFRTLAAALPGDPRHPLPGGRQGMDTAREDDSEDASTAAADGSAIGGAPIEGDELAAEPKDRVADAVGARQPKKEPDTTLADVDAFVECFITAGKKGIAVNRYKGLGEMNPETLWGTTMDPDARTLLAGPRRGPRRKPIRCSRR